MAKSDSDIIAFLEDLASRPTPRGPVALTTEYLTAVERAETLSANRPRADKTWVEASRRQFREYFARVRKVPRPR